MNVDYVNAFIGIIGTSFIIKNIELLLRHKKVRGLYWPVAIFFSLIGSWNIYLFYQVNLFWSWITAIPYSTANIIWLCMAFYYRSN